MSLAMSAVVRPSIVLRCLQAALGLASLGAAAAMLATADFLCAPGGAVVSALCGALLLRAAVRRWTTCRIDISGVGRIWLTVYQDVGIGAKALAISPSVPALLLAGSTLWPGLLLLRLSDADGRLVTLVVGVGSISRPLFRPLAVACRAIAARHHEHV